MLTMSEKRRHGNKGVTLYVNHEIENSQIIAPEISNAYLNQEPPFNSPKQARPELVAVLELSGEVITKLNIDK